MGIYRGAGGTGDAVNDASSEALITIQARDAALAAQAAAEAAQAAAELAETNAETAETNAETAETNAETAETNAEAAQTAAEAAQAAAEAVLVDPDFQAVVAIEADITTVAGIAADVTTVAGISADVTSVAAIDFDVTTVASDIADVTTVASNIGSVNTVSGISSNVTTVAGISSNVTTVAGISSNVTTVAGISGNVTTVATNNANVTTVATNIANINTVANDLNEPVSEINTVATDITNVNTVGTNIANVNTVAGISADVTTVAGDSADIQLLADNIATIAAKANAGANSDITSLSGLTTPLSVGQGGTGANTLTGYVKGAGTTALTAASTIPNTDITGLGTMSTQAASNVAITGGSINGTTVGATTASTGKFTTLEATGVTTVQAGTVSAPAITTSGDTNTGIFFPAADTIAFAEGGVEALRIDSSANVGIGTSSPACILDVTKSTDSGSTFPRLQVLNSLATQGNGSTTFNYARLDAKSGNGTVFADFGTRYDSYAGAFLGTETNHPIYFQTNGTERMRITSAGNVGIGTSSPNGLLHIGSSDGVVITNTLNELSPPSTGNDNFIFRSNNDGSLNFSSRPGGGGSYRFYTGTAVSMRITSSGNVGIGTTSPLGNLDVRGANQTLAGNVNLGVFTTDAQGINLGGSIGLGGLADTTIQFGLIAGRKENSTTNNRDGYLQFATFQNGVGVTERMRISSTGNVGIGTSSFTGATSGRQILELNGTSEAQINLDTGGTRRLQIYTADSISVFGTTTAIPLAIYTNDAERMRITSGGDVLIGTTTSSDKLTVSQSSNGSVGVYIENTNTGTSASAIARYKTSASTVAFSGLNGANRTAYGTLGNDVMVAGYTNSTAGATILVDAAGPITLGTNSTERMRIDSSGNVGIGTSSPRNVAGYSNLVLNGSTSGLFEINTNGTRVLSIYGSSNDINLINPTATGAMRLYTNDTERMRITSGGTLLVATTTETTLGSIVWKTTLSGGGNNLAVINNSSGGATTSAFQVSNYTGGSSNIINFYNGSGTLAGTISVPTNASTGTTVAYNTSSDYRLKENIAPMTGALAKVQQLKPVTYTWKSNGYAGQGFIAHELQAVVPDCVSGKKDAVDAKGNPIYQGVDTSFLVATLTAAIQELNTKVEAQAVRIAELESK